MCMQEANKPPDSWFELKVNSHVYVTGLPDDVTVDEVSHSRYFVLWEHVYCELNTNLGIFSGGRSVFKVWDNKRGEFVTKFQHEDALHAIYLINYYVSIYLLEHLKMISDFC